MSSDTDVKAPLTTVEITDYAELREAWTCPHLTAAISGPGDENFHTGTVMRLDGAEHAARRRALGQLLKKRGHKMFRDKWLLPTASAALSDVLSHTDADGVARVEILEWAQRVSMQLAAAITGFDEGTTQDGARDLFQLMETVAYGRPTSFDVVLGHFDSEKPAAKAAMVARAVIIDRFYNPSMARRQALLAKVTAGEMDEADLPQDLLMLIAQGVDPSLNDVETAHREAMFMLLAAVHTTSSATVWTLRELYEWWDQHPDQRGRVDDQEFLARAAAEAMRLHPVVPGFTRGATEELHLVHGTEVPEGSIAIFRSGEGNLDESVYGADAAQFNPDREVARGVNRYGFAFGAGTHMCYGLPLVMGVDGLDGSLVHLLTRILNAGGQPDPAQVLEPLAATRGVWASQAGGLRLQFVAQSPTQ